MDDAAFVLRRSRRRGTWSSVLTLSNHLEYTTRLCLTGDRVSSDGATTKRIYVLAGPNGAGKTTFAREFLAHEARCPIFINADLIAEGLSPFAPERVAIAAGRIMLAMIHQSVQRGDSFGFETTLAGRGYARLIPEWRSAGYDVRLLFLSLPTPEAAIARVSERVRQGGHSITEEVIRRRFRAGSENLERLYKPIVTSWILYDNSGEELEIVDYGENS